MGGPAFKLLSIGLVMVIVTSLSLFYAGAKPPSGLPMIEPSAGPLSLSFDPGTCLTPMAFLIGSRDINLSPDTEALSTSEQFILYAQTVSERYRANTTIEKIDYFGDIVFVKISTAGETAYFMFDNPTRSGCEISKARYESIGLPKNEVKNIVFHNMATP